MYLKYSVELIASMESSVRLVIWTFQSTKLLPILTIDKKIMSVHVLKKRSLHILGLTSCGWVVGTAQVVQIYSDEHSIIADFILRYIQLIHCNLPEPGLKGRMS